MGYDLRTLERRIQQLEVEIERMVAAKSAGGPIVVQTTRKVTYPTTAGVFYYAQIVGVSGTPTEGSAGTLTPLSDLFVYVRNLGTQVPPSGTQLPAWPVRHGRWVMDWNG